MDKILQQAMRTLGQRRMAKLTPKERKAFASKGGKILWNRLSTRERQDRIARMNQGRLAARQRQDETLELSTVTNDHERLPLDLGGIMNLRRLITKDAIAAFIHYRNIIRGAAYRPADREQDIERLKRSRLYGLYNVDGKLVAGISLHDLATWEQSATYPDLSQFEPTKVVEISDLWSLKPGAGPLAWLALSLPLRLLGIRALVAYLSPSTSTSLYRNFGFQPAPRLVQHKFLETPQGNKGQAQPVTLQGAELDVRLEVISRELADAQIIEIGSDPLQQFRNLSRKPLFRHTQSYSTKPIPPLSVE